MNTKIVEIIDRAIDNSHAMQEMHVSAIKPLRTDILEALSQAGYVIVPREYPVKLAVELLPSLVTAGPSQTWQAMLTAFENQDAEETSSHSPDIP